MLPAHMLYFAEDKLNQQYDREYPNEPIEKKTKYGGKVGAGGKLVFTGATGDLLKKVADVSIAAEPHAEAEFTAEWEKLYRTPATAKLVKLLDRLTRRKSLVDLILVAPQSQHVRDGAPVTFKGEVSVDREGRPEKQIKEDGHILLKLACSQFALQIRSSLVNMETPNAWLRLSGGSSLSGFGTIVHCGLGTPQPLGISPVVLAYG